MTRETGRVLAVTTSIAGDELAADAASGATTIFVVDAADFDEAGGLIQITHDVPTETDPVNAPGVLTNVLTAVTYSYSTVDDDTGAVTLVDPLIAAAVAGDRVDVLDPQTQAPAQEVVAEVALQGFDNDDSVEAIVNHALAAHLPEGIREEEGEVVVLDWQDDELRVVDILDQSPGLNSDAGGWSLDEGGASFSDLQVYGDLGVSSLTADAVSLGGVDLQTDVIDAMPKGLIVYAPATAGVNSASTASEQTVFQVNAGQMYGNRFYRITYSGNFVGASAAAGDIYLTQVRYTLDGSAPSTASTQMNKSLLRTYVGSAAFPIPFYQSWLYTPAADYDSVRFAFTTARSAGTGTPVIKNDDATFGFWLAVEDMGLQTNVGGTITQKSKATGTADADATATYTRSWKAQWGRSFQGDGSLLETPGEPTLYHGYLSSAFGNAKSQVGFDDADIRAKLLGATIQKVTLTYRVRYARQKNLAVVVRTHNNSTAPSSWSSASSIVATTSSVQGSTKTLTLPTSVGTSFKNGTARGIAFGPGSSTADIYAGTMYGAATDSAPKLTITYSK